MVTRDGRPAVPVVDLPCAERDRRTIAAVATWRREAPDGRLALFPAKCHSLTLPPITWRCAMVAEAATRGPDAPYAKLTEVASRLQMPAGDAHNALVDVRTTLAVVRAIADDT